VIRRPAAGVTFLQPVIASVCEATRGRRPALPEVAEAVERLLCTLNQSSQDPTTDIVSAALALHRSGKLVEAARLYRSALVQAPANADALCYLAMIYCQQGQFAEGADLLRRAVAVDPRRGSTHNLLGMTYHRLGQIGPAITCFDLAIACDPGRPDAHGNRAALMLDLRRYSEAIESCDRALSLMPESVTDWCTRGAALAELARYEDAIASYDHALARDPRLVEAHVNRGQCLAKLERYEEALGAYAQTLAINPNIFEAHNDLGNVLQKLGRLQEAAASYDRAIALDSNRAEAFFNRGNALRALKCHEEAVANYDLAIVLKPAYPEAFNNRGLALSDLKRHEDALASYDQALGLNPAHAEALNNRAMTLTHLNRHEDALESYDKATALAPDRPEFFTNRAAVLIDLKRFDQAIVDLDRAIALRADYGDALWNRAWCKLLLGRYREGYADFEWRWHTTYAKAFQRAFQQPQWDGKCDISDKAILLHSEQGFGDTIMAARYIPRVANSAARVILEVPTALMPLLEHVVGVVDVVTRGGVLPSFDIHCPMMSLLPAFDTTLESMPSHVPYLSVPRAHAEKWTLRLPRNGVPRIGISWAGNPKFPHDAERSIGLPPMLPLFDRQDVHYFSIQRDLRDGDADILGSNHQITHLGDAIESFADTAAIIASMDLVISSDTSMVHLAGALGKPVWVLLQFVPDWRWLLDRIDSPWYPTARLFRQRVRNDWNSVISDVERALSEWLVHDNKRSD
jgi:tetratricopeptide (TPR) repeat protein